MISYISPSSLSRFYRDPVDFYLHYVSPNRAPREPQTKPMAVGQAFDTWIKDWLAVRFDVVSAGKSSPFDDAPDGWTVDEVMADGKIIFDQYQVAGCLRSLCKLIEKVGGRIIMEDAVNGVVPSTGIPVLGKPDLMLYNQDAGLLVTLDYKVNGFYSQASPKPGYQWVVDGWTNEMPHSRGNMSTHKDYWPEQLKVVGGVIEFNGWGNLALDWFDQLAIYSWCASQLIANGSAVSNVLVGVEQVCGVKNTKFCRFASHLYRLLPIEKCTRQQDLVKRLDFMWKTLLSGHFFYEMTREESDARCRDLDAIAGMYGTEAEVIARMAR